MSICVYVRSSKSLNSSFSRYFSIAFCAAKSHITAEFFLLLLTSNHLSCKVEYFRFSIFCISSHMIISARKDAEAVVIVEQFHV